MPSEQLNRKSWLIVKSSAEVPGRHLRIRSGNQAHPAARDAALRHHVSRAGIRSSGMPAAVRLSSHDVRREHIDRRFPHFHSADDDSSLPCHHSLSVGTIRARRDLRFFLRSSLLFISTRPDSWGVESRPSQGDPRPWQTSRHLTIPILVRFQPIHVALDSCERIRMFRHTRLDFARHGRRIVLARWPGRDAAQCASTLRP